MSKRFYILVAFVFLASLWTIPAMAQFGAIEGNVKMADGTPGNGAIISIERTDMKGHWDYTIKPKDKGHYYYGGLPIGMYSVTVKVNGKDADNVKGVRVGLGDAVKVDFDLKQQEVRQQAAAAGIQIPQAQGPGGGEQKLTKEQIAKIQEEEKKRDESKKKQNALQSAFNAGRDALAAKNCEEAVTQFNVAATNDPTQVAVFANMGEAYNCVAKTKSGDEKKEALMKSDEAYNKALALKPDDGAVHHNLGLVMVAEGKIPEGIAELNKATQLDPASAGKYYFNLGAILTNLGKGDEAATAFQSAIKADPNYAEAYYQLATALMSKATLDAKTGKITPAPGTVESFQKYLELTPEGPNAAIAKSMIETLGGSVTTEIKTKRDAPVKKKP